jgi:hypothetical protein
MLSNNLLLLIVVVLFVISEVNKNNQINNLKKERFYDNHDQEVHSRIDSVSISNLSTLASNLISNNGQDLTLSFANVKLGKNLDVATSDDKAENINMHSNRINLNSSIVKIEAFRYMIAPFYIDFNNLDIITYLNDTFWFLCDGQNDTPDLQGRFIWGGSPTNVNRGGGNNNEVGNVGGETRVTLGIGQIPSHTHNITSGEFTTDGQCGAHYCNNRHGERTSISTGGGQAHENMPPYMVIAYFMYDPPAN